MDPKKKAERISGEKVYLSYVANFQSALRIVNKFIVANKKRSDAVLPHLAGNKGFKDGKLTDAEKEELAKTQYIMCGIIQCVAVFAFGPLQAVTVAIKQEIKVVIESLTKKTPKLIAAARISAKALTVGLTTIKNTLADLSTNIVAKLGSSAFGDAVKWISKKLGGGDVIQWIVKFFSTTVPAYITKFLKLLAKLNPTSVAAGTGGQEFNQVMAEEIGKIAVNKGAATKITNTISSWSASFTEFAQNHQPSQAYQSYQAANPGRRIAGGLD
jgi:hypothetical protein